MDITGSETWIQSNYYKGYTQKAKIAENKAL